MEIKWSQSWDGSLTYRVFPKWFLQDFSLAKISGRIIIIVIKIIIIILTVQTRTSQKYDKSKQKIQFKLLNANARQQKERKLPKNSKNKMRVIRKDNIKFS